AGVPAAGGEAATRAARGRPRAALPAGVGAGVATTAFEHKGVLAPGDRLEREGFRVARVPVDGAGIVDLGALEAALDERTVVVSVMLVNNEVGTIQPLDAVAELVRARAPRAALHTDAVQAVPWLAVATAAAAAHPAPGPPPQRPAPQGVPPPSPP